LTDILGQAHDLSYTIQRDFVYGHLIHHHFVYCHLTLASNGLNGYGTYALGLDKSWGEEREALLMAERIPDDCV
jgi:hypothetical protein